MPNGSPISLSMLLADIHHSVRKSLRDMLGHLNPKVTLIVQGMPKVARCLGA
jgi:hypothetical protein